MSGRLQKWAEQLRHSTATLMLAMKHPNTPWYAKACGAVTLLYALSPIDLIPDFIPVIGYVDDLILVPLGIWLTVKLVPVSVWAECEAEATRRALEKPPKNWRGAILIVLLWLLLLALGLWLGYLLFGGTGT